MSETNSTINMSAVNTVGDSQQPGSDEMGIYGPEFVGVCRSTEPHAVRNARRSVVIAFLIVFLIAFGIITEHIPLPF